MNAKTFSLVFANLCDAFNLREINEGTARIYAERLKKIPDKVLIRACDEIIDNEHRFPTVATILNYCHEITTNAMPESWSDELAKQENHTKWLREQGLV